MCKFTPCGILATGTCVAILGMFLINGCTTQSGNRAGPPTSATDNTVAPDHQASLVAREIEEADIVKYDGGYLYLANRYLGLRVIDIRTVDQPVLVGGADATGRGVELYVRGDHVFLVTSADVFYCAGTPVGFADVGPAGGFLDPGYEGSRVWVYDVSNPANPQSVAVFDSDGFVTATRRVGDVLYLTGNEIRDFGPTGRVFVQSINIADPADPQPVATDYVTGEALEIHASARAIYVAGHDPDMEDTTRVTCVDIADPGGAVVIRDTFRVPGTIRNRFFMDEFDDTFRVVTQERLPVSEFEWRDVVALFVYDVRDPDDVLRLSRLPIELDEDAWAVRYDGERAYVVTFRQIDPLFVVDLSDPAAPRIAGELEVPGFSTHIVPLGDRLLAIGFDGDFELRPAVSLYDVENPARPRLLSRVRLGDRNVYNVTSEATFDEKALRVLEDEQLVLVPFSYIDDESLDWVDAVQLIDLHDRFLVERGTSNLRGLVRRTDVLDGRLWMLSDEAFGVYDIDDRDEPAMVSTLDIITEQELLDAGLADCADSARYRQNPGVFLGPVDFVDFGWWWFWPCGVMGFASIGMGLVGLVGLRLSRRLR
jgi:hypothetical protein